jgi:ABC-2 type transport system ATP-binding protein
MSAQSIRFVEKVSWMSTRAVAINELVKAYSTGLKAIDGVTLTVDEGEIFGLIGPNGAGKTTTLRILGTLLKPTSGTVTVLGHDVVQEQMTVRGLISYLPEDAGAYENLSGREYLAFMAGFYEGDAKKTVDIGVRIADLKERIDSRIKEYSKGMKRRLLIARALMTAPKLAILDEPTAGLDVMHALYVRERVKGLIKERGTTAVLSSHNLLEVEFMCDRVALIDHGRIHETGTPSELKGKYGAQNLEEVFMEVVKRAA